MAYQEDQKKEASNSPRDIVKGTCKPPPPRSRINKGINQQPGLARPLRADFLPKTEKEFPLRNNLSHLDQSSIGKTLALKKRER